MICSSTWGCIILYYLSTDWKEGGIVIYGMYTLPRCPHFEFALNMKLVTEYFLTFFFRVNLTRDILPKRHNKSSNFKPTIICIIFQSRRQVHDCSKKKEFDYFGWYLQTTNSEVMPLLHVWSLIFIQFKNFWSSFLLGS